jgi:hypothetical protein
MVLVRSNQILRPCEIAKFSIIKYGNAERHKNWHMRNDNIPF